MFEFMLKNVEKMSINYSPNFYPKKRSISKVKYLIFHYTGMRSEKSAIKRLLDNSKKTLDQEYENSSKTIKDKLQSAKKKTLDKI